MTTTANEVCEQLKTQEGFLQAVASSTPLAFAEMAAGLTEADRKKLSKSAQELLQKARPKERANFGWPTHEGHMARLALLAVGPRSQACRPMSLEQRPQRGSLFSIPQVLGPNPYEEAAVQILTDRKPDWADDWLNCQIAAENRSLSWRAVRGLIRRGVCRTPDSPAYLQLVARFGLGADFDQDPDLLEDAWKLFQVPTHAFDFVAQIKHEEAAKWKESPGRSWPEIFYYYAHHGRLDRGRLIDELLKALWREFAPTERAGLMHFHNLLSLTEEELIGRQSAYIDLLRAPAAPVVTFALTVIKSLVPAKTFDADAALKAVPAVFEIASKSQPKSALSLMKKLVRERPDLKQRAVEAAWRALSHPESDVQLAALECLETWGGEGLPRETLLEVRRFVSPVVRPHLDRLLSGATDDSAPTVSGTTVECAEHDEREATRPPLSSSDLRARIERISPAVKEAWKLDESLAAWEAGQFPPPAQINAAGTVLAGLSKIVPIADVEELIDAIGQALEAIDSPMEIERILDGLSRFGLERHGDFMARTSALRDRIRSLDPEMRMSSLLACHFLLPGVFKLLGHWLGIGAGAQPDWLRPANQPVPIYQVLDLRAGFVRSKLYEQSESGELLSFPTHEHGWIDSRVFVERIRKVDASNLERSRLDLRFGLLRLAPDFSDEAIREAADLPDPVNRIVRYALGDDVSPTGSDHGWKAEWLAAGRVRSPRGRLDELEPLDLPPAANAVLPAEFRVRLDRLPADSEQRRHQFYLQSEAYVEVEPATQMKVNPAEYPVLVFSQRLARHNDSRVMFSGMPAWAEGWLASLWPSNTEPFVAGAIQNLLLRLDNPGSGFEILAAASSLSPLLRPERDWPPTAIYALWLAMFSRDADSRAVATDALVEGILDGRAHPEPLAEILVEIARYDWAKLNRLADGLRQVARISPWGCLVISRILDRLIASWQELPRDAHHILEVQLELLLELNGRLSEPARMPLEPVTGGSKTARLARQLLALHGAGCSPECRAALLEGLELRVTHAENAQKAVG